MLRSGCSRAGATVSAGRLSTFRPPAARPGPWWPGLLTLPMLWALAAPAHAQEPAFLVRDINGGPFPATSYLGPFVRIGATTFFWAYDGGVTGFALWKSDGTEAGTVRVKDIRPYPGSSSPELFVDVNGTLFFAADDGVTGMELWKSDGTEAGTVRVKDIRPGSGSSFPGF